MEEKNRQQLETKGDLQDARNELQIQIQEFRNDLEKQIEEVRSEIQKIHKELYGMRIELMQQAGHLETKQLRHLMTKWGSALLPVMFGVMAKGFGWLGF